LVRALSGERGLCGGFYTLMFVVPLFKPTLFNGLVFGALSVVVLWFYFMPCMGKGVMARHTATPVKARSVALANHQAQWRHCGCISLPCVQTAFAHFPL
jgi:hypothetical protein